MELKTETLRRSLVLSTLFLLLLIAGCAGTGPAAFNDGLKYFEAGDYDNAVAAYMQAVEISPGNPEYRMRLNFARARAAVVHKERADELFAAGNYQKALNEYQVAARFDATIETTQESIRNTQNHLDAQKLVEEGREFLKKHRTKQAKKAAELALQLVPEFSAAAALLNEVNSSYPTIIDGVVLEVVSSEPITLNLNKVKMPDVFKILTDLSGINFILDDDIRSKTATLYLEEATFAQALELLLSMNKLDKKILNPKTIILFPKNKDKQKQFEDQVIQTFYLSNIDAKKAVNMLRTILQLRKVYVHEELNAVVIRDNPAVIRLAEKIIEANDRAGAEVVFDLELIEISHSDDLRIGPKIDPYGFSVGLKTADSTGNVIENIVVDSLDNLDVLYSLPTATFDMYKNNGDGEVLASPKIRVKNKEKAKVHIGSREPVVTVTINGDQTSENVQYIDVGVKLDVEPAIQLDDTVVTKLGLEVSNVAGRSTTTNGTAVLTISTTTANTSLTLKDGEQTVLGGLIRTSETKATSSLPILGDIPLIGKLFTSYSNEKAKREILLSITPHIVKSLDLPQRDITSLWSGGEDDFKNGRNFGSFADDYQAGQESRPPSPVPSTTPRRMIDLSVPEMDEAESLQPAAPTPKPEAAKQPAVKAAAKVESAIKAEGAIEVVQLPTQTTPGEAKSALVFILGNKLVNNGATFELFVIAEEITDLFSAPMTVSYDDKLLEFVGASEGSLMKKEGKTVFTSSEVPGQGEVIVGLKFAEDGQGVSGGGALFKLDFKAKGPGVAEIKTGKLNLRTSQGAQIPAAENVFKVEIVQ
ncbi:MAG: cohesin domain-containing protein [Desulfuromonadales bacterium]|nr:cohesin domain-containing protein [Desulfuromonadales bacterium]